MLHDTLKITVLKRPQIRLQYPPPKKKAIFWVNFFSERFNFELENFYSGETYFGASRVWVLGDALIRPALLGHEF